MRINRTAKHRCSLFGFWIRIGLAETAFHLEFYQPIEFDRVLDRQFLCQGFDEP